MAIGKHNQNKKKSLRQLVALAITTVMAESLCMEKEGSVLQIQGVKVFCVCLCVSKNLSLTLSHQYG